MTTIITTTIAEPAILSANTFYWNSADTSAARRSNEERNTSKVASYLESIGFIITDRDTSNITAVCGNVEVKFHYSETCNNVYKSLYVQKDGKKSNITTIRKIANSLS